MPFLPVTLKSLRKKDFDFEPQTLGDHIRKRRLVLGLTQKSVGQQLGATIFTVINWESGHCAPDIRFMPKIIQFLGYDPISVDPESIPERLAAKRRSLGWSQRMASQKLGIDPTAWSSWENGGTILLKIHRKRISRFLGIPEEALNQAMRRQWNKSHGKI